MGLGTQGKGLFKKTELIAPSVQESPSEPTVKEIPQEKVVRKEAKYPKDLITRMKRYMLEHDVSSEKEVLIAALDEYLSQRQF